MQTARKGGEGDDGARAHFGERLQQKRLEGAAIGLKNGDGLVGADVDPPVLAVRQLPGTQGRNGGADADGDRRDSVGDEPRRQRGIDDDGEAEISKHERVSCC